MMDELNPVLETGSSPGISDHCQITWDVQTEHISN